MSVFCTYLSTDSVAFVTHSFIMSDESSHDSDSDSALEDFSDIDEDDFDSNDEDAQEAVSLIFQGDSSFIKKAKNAVCALAKKRRRSKRMRGRNAQRDRYDALEKMDALSDATFERMFRMDRCTFESVLDRISSFIKLPNEVKGTNSSGSVIPLKTRLAVTLRWLAGGSYLDLCFSWGISSSTFYHSSGVLWPTLEALDAAYSMGLPFDDEEQLEALSSEFRYHSGGILDGCIMAIDGFAVLTRQPFRNEVQRPKDYRFRKSGFAIIVLGGCDNRGRFICASCDHSGSTNDIIAFQNSKLFEALYVEHKIPEKYFIIGDEAFTCTEQVLSPWPGNFFFVLPFRCLCIVLIQTVNSFLFLLF